jgi:hypothetical protein
MEIIGLTNTETLYSYKEQNTDYVSRLDAMLKLKHRCPILEEKVFFDVYMKMTLKDVISLKYVRAVMFRLMNSAYCVQQNYDGSYIVKVSIAEAIDAIYQLTQPIMRKEIPSIITSIRNVIDNFMNLAYRVLNADIETKGLDNNIGFDSKLFAKDMQLENIKKCLANALHTNYIDTIPAQDNVKDNQSELCSSLISEHPEDILCEKLTPSSCRLIIPYNLLNDPDALNNDDLFNFICSGEVIFADIHLFKDNENYQCYQIDVLHPLNSSFINQTYGKTLQFAMSKV